MDADKKFLFDIVSLLDKISIKINSELSALKKKIDFAVFKPPLKDYHKKFFNDILLPLSEKRPTFSIKDIKLICEKTKPLAKSTIRCYLSTLKRNDHIKIIKNRDKRDHLYQII
ncbi:MAG: hypothetical protein ACFFD7_05625 [Candidatus Thorarchaeota archaeon]